MRDASPYVLPAVVAALLIGSVGPASGDEPPRSRYGAVERMTLTRLAAAHADAARNREARRAIGTLPVTAGSFGLHDYRAILHAHAEDSAHTGGTRAEMLRDARAAGVDAILLSDHFRPPRDFMESWRGLREGVLFIPGSETHGFVIHPDESMMEVMTKSREEIIAAATRGSGLCFLSHVEDRVDHSLAGLTGMEVYNRHADAKDDWASVAILVNKMTTPAGAADLEEALRLYPDELLAAQVDYPALYMKKWDEETRKRRVVGIAANDCHHNQVFIVKKLDDRTALVGTIVDDDDEMRRVTADVAPGVAELLKGHSEGDVVVRLDFDPYYRSFRNASTHILATELTEPAIRAALRAGRAYVSHDWMCDPEGFLVYAERGGERVGLMGDQLEFAPGQTIVAQAPLACRFCLYRDGRFVETKAGSEYRRSVEEPGVYRIEAWLTIGGEERPWVYANPVIVRPAELGAPGPPASYDGDPFK